MRQGHDRNFRDGFGSSLFRYAFFLNGYDPISGQSMSLSPARQLMKASLIRWMDDFHIDGIRMDSVENVCNWDFIQEYKDLARGKWRQDFAAQGADTGADERFLVVGEELTEPLEILGQHRLDGLWHESFKKYIRAALLGQNAEGESFEATVRKAIDCRSFGYGDLTQAVIYLTSHDVEGFRNERLFNFLLNNGVSDAGRRIKLGFACLLTSVGVPMILAGDEFADQHDLFDSKGGVTQTGGKQVDPVNFSRLEDEWRGEIKNYVTRLIKLRTSSEALAVNDTEFIHSDFNDGKRVVAWRRIGTSDRERSSTVRRDRGRRHPWVAVADNNPRLDPARPRGPRRGSNCVGAGAPYQDLGVQHEPALFDHRHVPINGRTASGSAGSTRT
jgi:1,4-alpha-glucan branching enzyme